MEALVSEFILELQAQSGPLYLPCFDTPQLPFSPGKGYGPGVLFSDQPAVVRGAPYFIEALLEPHPLWPDTQMQVRFSYEVGDPYHGGSIESSESVVARHVWLSNANCVPGWTARFEQWFEDHPLIYHIPE